jgi:hypothetical protein
VVLLGGGLVGLAVACQPGSASPNQPTAEPTQADPFAVVRATADAAYRAGRADLDRGQLEQALVELDQAKTNDPDNRQDIQQALDETIRRIQALPPVTATEIASGPGPGALVTPPAVAQTQAVRADTPPAVAQTEAVRATSQVGATAARTAAPGQVTSTQPAAGPTAGPAGQAGTVAPGERAAAATEAAGAGSTPGPAGVAAGASTAGRAGASGLVMWRDAQGRFSIGAPPGWETLQAPQTMFGTGVVGFREAGGQAELDVAVDTSSRAVSPELYAASMELAMQQVPGYALDSVQPGTTAGAPSVRRVFSQTRRDAAGHDYTARGFQVAIVRGSTAYVVSASSPADRYAEYGSTFDRMLDSLAFS